MKKVLKGLTLALVVCLLAGCGAEEKLTCTLTEKTEFNETTQSVTTTFKDNKIQTTSMEMKMVMPSEEAASLSFSMMESMFPDDVEGVKVDTKQDKETIIVTMSIDYAKVSEEYLTGLEDGTPTKDATKEDVKKSFEDAGFECK